MKYLVYVHPWHIECSEQKIYEGNICSVDLEQWRACFSGLETNFVQVPSHVNQDKAENMARSLLAGLQILSPRGQECVTAIKPFICLYLFGLCDAHNHLHQVSQADCVRIRDELCMEQWKTATMILGEGVLPDCSAFENRETQCLGMLEMSDHREVTCD